MALTGTQLFLPCMPDATFKIVCAEGVKVCFVATAAQL
jgi:hypothetical protein